MSNFFKTFSYFFSAVIILTLFIACSSIQIISSNNSNFSTSNGKFIWPIPNYTYISSYFGTRSSPTAGASSYHSGIDIPAPCGTNILSICNGTVSFASWGAGGGYTIVVQSDNNICISYCHVSPNFTVHKGYFVNTGDIISSVGPKNVYGIINNPYIDSNGNPTNGATTGSHLHLTIKKDGKAVNPLNFINV